MKKPRDVRRILFVVGMLLVPFVTAALVYGFFSMSLFRSDAGFRWTATVGAFLVALVLVLAVLFVLWLRLRAREGRLESGLVLGTGRPDAKGEIEALRKSWKESVSKLRATAVAGGGRQALGALPWYVIIGAPASGKSTLLRQSGIDFPVGDAALRGLQGTRNCDWWFSNVGIFLDTAGRYISDESAAEWASFLELVRRQRVGSPINGVIVAIPAKDLVEMNDGQQELEARRIRARLDELIDHLGINFPVWIVVTKVDLVGGFVEFFGNADPITRQQMMGWTLDPHEGGKFQLAAFEARYEHAVRRLFDIRPAMVAAAKLRDRPAAFGFPDEMRALGDPLGRMLQRIFAPNVYQETPLCRGIYITSATQQGTPLLRAAAKVREMLGAPAVDADAPASAVHHAYFVKDLMHERILVDQAMTWTTSAETERGRHRRVGINLIGCSVGVLLAFLSLTIATHGMRGIEAKAATVADAEVTTTTSAVERLEAIRGVHESFPEKPGLVGTLDGSHSTRDAVRRREIQRYRASVEDVLEESAKARVAAAGPSDVGAALDAARDFDGVATLVRAISDEVKARREAERTKPAPLEPAPVPAVAALPEGAAASSDPVVKEAARLAVHLRLKWADRPQLVALLDSAGKRTMPALAGANVIPPGDAEPGGRFALSVWRNHEFARAEGDAAWGASLDAAVKERLQSFLADEAQRVAASESAEKSGAARLELGLEKLKKALDAVDTLAEDRVDAAEDLRVTLEEIATACGATVGANDGAAPAAASSASPPDWAGLRAAETRLAELEAKNAPLAQRLETSSALARIRPWLQRAPAAGAVSVSRTAESCDAVRGIESDVRAWLEKTATEESSELRRAKSLAEAADGMQKTAANAAKRLRESLLPRMKAIGWDSRVPPIETMAARYVYAIQLDGFLAGKTPIASFRRLADRLDLEGETPHGSAALRAVAESLVSLIPPTGQGGPLPTDLSKRLAEALRVEFARRVERVADEWAAKIRELPRLTSELDSKPFLRQFAARGESARVVKLAQLFEQRFPRVELKGPAKEMWDATVKFPDDYLLLSTSRLERVWERIRDYADAAESPDVEQYRVLVRALRTRVKDPLDLTSNAAAEREVLDDLRKANDQAEQRVYESVQSFLDARWRKVRELVLRGRKGEKLSDPEREDLRGFRDLLEAAFPNGAPCGRLALANGVSAALDETLSERSAAARRETIAVSVSRPNFRFDQIDRPYLMVRYADQDGAESASRVWSTADPTAAPLKFNWIPAKAKSFEFLRCRTPDGGDPVSLFAKQGDTCVLDAIDAATGNAPGFRWSIGKDEVKLDVVLDPRERAEALRPKTREPAAEPPQRSTELTPRGGR